MDNVVFVDFRRDTQPIQAPAPTAGVAPTSVPVSGAEAASARSAGRSVGAMSMGQIQLALGEIRRSVDALARRTKAVQVEAQQTALLAQDLREQTLELAEALGDLDARLPQGPRPPGSFRTH